MGDAEVGVKARRDLKSSSPRRRGSSDFMPARAKALDSCLRGNDEQKRKPTSTRLGDVVNFKRGYDLPESARRPGPYPVISSAGISGYHDEYKVRGEGLVTGRYGTLGEMHYYNGDYWPHNTALYVTDFKGNVPKYVYYLLACLGHLNTGDKSAVPGVNRNDLHELIVPLIADVSVQRDVAAVLSALDAKIDLNHRINAELEALAKTIYDYWFVQFDFPDAHGRPYKSSGGKMVWNDTLKREIPAGWAVDLLGNMVENLDSKRVPLSKKQREERAGNIPYYGATGLMGYVDVPLFDEELLLLAEDGSVMDDHGRVVLQRIWGKAWVNNHAHVLRPSDGWTVDLLYHALRNILAIRMMSGSIQKKITQDNLNATLILVPPAAIRHSLARILWPLRERQKQAAEESAELTHLRDWLLPLLMNGQVRVV